MSIPVAKGEAKRPKVAEGPGDVLAVPIGSRTLSLLEVAYRARRPVLLEGPTGIGKSQVCAELAARLGLDYQVLDLSLLEPPDLVGLPVIEGGRTRYASPAELPTQGRGILMLEELNRAEIPVMQPALQLLSARRLHAYELPPGWSCVAAINPEDGEYQVNRMDPALRSRFLQLSVFAEPSSWLAWAATANVHSAIVRVVADHADAFVHASPRSWAYASEILHTLTEEERGDADLVRVALRGYLPTAWALVVTQALAGYPVLPPFDAAQILSADGSAMLEGMVAQLKKSGRIDAIAALSAKIRHVLGGAEFAERASEGAIGLPELESLLSPLPGDLREQCLDTAVRSSAAGALLLSLGHDTPAAVRAYASAAPTALQTDVAAWREAMQVHRVRLVSGAVMQWLRTVDDELDALRGLAPALRRLAGDLGTFGADLQRWLRVRGASDEKAAR